MLDGLTEWTTARLDPTSVAMLSALLIAWVSLVYLSMAFGARAGDLVFSGRHVGRLPAEQRLWSFFYGAVLLGAGIIILDLANAIPFHLVPERWQQSAGFLAAAVPGIAAVFGLVRGSRWERMLFVPITLLCSGVAIWITFL